MNINLTWDSSVSSAPDEAAFKAAVQAAATNLDSAIASNVTVTIAVGWGEDAGSSIPSDALATGGPTSNAVSYAQLTSALKTAAQTNGNTALTANLGTTDPVAAVGGQWNVGMAEAKALGLGSLFTGSTAVDGTVGFGSTENWAYGTSVGASQYDLIGVAMHEIAHALGRISFDSTGYYDPLNLYTYASAGNLQLTSGQSAYFSVNGGVTSLNPFDTLGDTADWASSVSGDSFGYGAAGVPGQLTFTDLQVMEALGFHMAPAYAITGASSLNPGSSVALTVESLDVAAGTTVDYTITGLPASSLASGSTTGSVTLAAGGTGTIDLGVAANVQDTGSSSLQVSLNGGLASTTVTVGGSPFTPGYITSSSVSTARTGTITNLSWNFSVDQLPTNGTNYQWLLEFYGANSSNDSGQLGIQTNGYGNQSGGLGSSLEFTLWGGVSGTAGSGGTVTSGSGYINLSTPFSFSAGTAYTFTLTQSGGKVTASVLDDATNVSTTLGFINQGTADNVLSGNYATSSEVGAQVASAADVAPVNATWNSFVANGTGGIDTANAGPYSHSTTATANGVDYATVLTPTGLTQYTGGSGNATITLAAGDNTVWLGTQADNVVSGSSGTDTINMGNQNGTVTLGGAADVVNGGNGNTLVVFSGPSSHYTITGSYGAGYTVTDSTGANGTATLTNVDFLKFSDKTVYVGPALTTAAGALTSAATVDALYAAVNDQAPGSSQATLSTGLTGTQLATQLLTQAGLTDPAAGLKAVFANLGLSTTGDSGLATDAANNQAGLYSVMVYLLQNDAGVQAAGGLGFAVNWLAGALAGITSANTSYAAYSSAAGTLDSAIAAAAVYAQAHTGAASVATATVGIAGVLTQPFNQVA